MNRLVSILLFQTNLFAVLMLAPVACFASDWEAVAATGSALFYMDFDSVTSSGKYIKVWTGIQYEKPQLTDFEPKKEYGSQKALYYFNCKEKTSAATQILLYGAEAAHATVVDSITDDLKTVRFAEVVPDSIGETLLLTACSPKKRDETKAVNETARKVVEKVMRESKQNR